jgi:hypothetical protein
MINKFNRYGSINESATRLPNSEDYWLKKGKKGKYVALYTHDDLDGIFCANLMKKYLINHGFSIVKYGILNYTESWKLTVVDPELINVVLDFANMPGDERDAYIDFYLDHHGDFTDAEKEKYKNQPIQKLHTGSAYEALCKVLGVPQDELTVHVIDMVDAAKYTEYGVDWQRLLKFDLNDMKKSDKVRLEFAAAFNQFIKRSDTSTLVEVIDNCNDASIYAIYIAMKKLYPGNNPYPTKPDGTLKSFKNDKGKWEKPTQPYKDFVNDRTKILDTMNKRTSGIETIKKRYLSSEDFLKDFGINNGTKVKCLDSYKLIGDLVIVPHGTWANALRARVIIERDFNNGRLKIEPKFILLDYENTLQVCSYKKMETYSDLPILPGNYKVEDLGNYMNRLLTSFKKPYIIKDGKNIGGGLDYYDPKTSSGVEDEVTVSGGHIGIGSISNINSICQVGPYKDIKYVDMFKNKIINDLSGIKFPINLSWQVVEELPENKWMLNKIKEEPKMDNNVRNIDDLRKINTDGNIVQKFKK